VSFIDRLDPEARSRFGTYTSAYAAAGIGGDALGSAVERRLIATGGGDGALAMPELATLLCAAYMAELPPLSPLRAAATVPFGVYAVVDYLSASSDTVAEAFEQLARYFRLVAPNVLLRLEEREARVTVSVVDERSDTWFFDEWSLGVTFSRFRELLGGAFRLERASLRCGPPNEIEAIEASSALLGCGIDFDAAHASFTLSADTWRTPLPSRDGRIRAALEQHARELLSEVEAGSKLSLKVREIVATEIGKGEPAIDAVAKRLALTPRTLQRRLRDESTTFHDVVEGLRADLAARYLRDRTLGITEVAFLLGYADASAFARAHKRWTGHPPAALRDSSRPRHRAAQ
jgi:AraC-like DNA-binding protein